MRVSRLWVLLVAAVLPLASCAVDRTYGTAPSYQVPQLESLPAPELPKLYRFGPQELLNIEVVGAEPLSGQFLTDAEGNLVYPLIGEIPISGLSPREASDAIAAQLRGEYLVDPQVRVIPLDFKQPTISIGGQVERPGNYEIKTKPSLLRVVNEAGGLAEYAKLDDILIMRTVRGQQYIGLYNIGAIQRGNYPDPTVYPEDIVMVGDSPERRRIDRILEFAPVLSSTVLILNQLNN